MQTHPYISANVNKTRLNNLETSVIVQYLCTSVTYVCYIIMSNTYIETGENFIVCNLLLAKSEFLLVISPSPTKAVLRSKLMAPSLKILI